jgi:hypothetical protein
VEPFTNSNTPPLSIAQVDSTVYGEPGPASPGSKRAAADLLALQEALLAAVVTRVGEVESAEWALDQDKAASDLNIDYELAAGVTDARVAAVAGEQAPDLTEFVEDREPELAED